MINIYFDTEFTQLCKNTTLISIGLIADNGRYFYAEFTDYNKDLVNDWIEENVIANLKFKDDNYNNYYAKSIFNHKNDYCDMYKNVCCVECKGSKSFISNELIKWLKGFDATEDNYIQFVSDVCNYDFVLIIDLLWGCALYAPNWISPYCHDINQDIASYYHISDKEAFDMTREDMVAFGEDERCKHNSLYDARVIKAIYQLINNKEEA